MLRIPSSSVNHIMHLSVLGGSGGLSGLGNLLVHSEDSAAVLRMPKRAVVELAANQVLCAAAMAVVQRELHVVELQAVVIAAGSVVVGDVVTMTKSVVRTYVSDATR